MVGDDGGVLLWDHNFRAFFPHEVGLACGDGAALGAGVGETRKYPLGIFGDLFLERLSNSGVCVLNKGAGLHSWSKRQRCCCFSRVLNIIDSSFYAVL